ncbi:MAG TPA: hypothetical protein VLX92_18090 [Kofleriaceae bacterium]|nr:hypothetical protein [Kofleriaceae bacterium]
MRRLICVLSFATACGSGAHARPDAAGSASSDASSDAAGSSSDLGALMPREVAGDAHAVMATPTVVAITYDADPNRDDIEALYTQYAASPAWTMQTAEYGIGALAVGTPRHLGGTAATSDAQVRQLLTANLGGTSPAWGAPNEDTLYSVTIPVGTAFTDQTGASFCGGYHDDFMIGTVDVAYAIQLPCTLPPPVTALQSLTFALSHELVEGVTDPRFETDYAWGDVDPAHEVWAYVTDGELADMCEFASTWLWTDAPGMTYAIQRIWSNAAAHAGTDPCVGDPTAPYAQSVPDQPDATTIALFGGSVSTNATKVAIGATGSITVHVAGTGPGPFTVTAYDVATLYFDASKPLLTFTQPTGSYHVGDTVTIPVTVVAKDANLGGAGAEAFEIDTAPASGPTTYFYGLVSQ